MQIYQPRLLKYVQYPIIGQSVPVSLVQQRLLEACVRAEPSATQGLQATETAIYLNDPLSLQNPKIYLGSQPHEPNQFSEELRLERLIFLESATAVTTSQEKCTTDTNKETMLYVLAGFSVEKDKIEQLTNIASTGTKEKPLGQDLTELIGNKIVKPNGIFVLLCTKELDDSGAWVGNMLYKVYDLEPTPENIQNIEKGFSEPIIYLS